MHYLCTAKAQMAESVDALVSNTSGVKSIPVRSRVWVQEMPDNRDYRAFLISAEQIPSKKWDSGIIPASPKS